MISASRGFYRNKIVSVTPVTPTVAPTMAPKFQVTTYNILTGGKPWSGMSEYEAETTGLPHALWKNRRHLVVNALVGSQVVMLNEATIDQTKYIIKNHVFLMYEKKKLFANKFSWIIISINSS